MVVGIIQADIPSAYPVLFLFVPIEADVHTVIIRHGKVVAFTDIINGVDASPQEFRNVERSVLLLSQRASVTSIIDPSARQVEPLAESMIHGETKVVPSVVFGQENFAIVDNLSRLVKLTFRL